MKNYKLSEMQLEENIVTLIEDEDYDGAGASPMITETIGISIDLISAAVDVADLFGITSACTRDCWHP